MPPQSHAIVTGLVIGIIVLLIATSFIVILVSYSNTRKRKFFQEKQKMQLLFNEQLLRAQLEIQEQTFNSISQEIHDNVGQLLSLAKVQVNILEVSDVMDRILLADLKESIGKAMVDLRDIATSMNTDRIKQSGLVEMINHELHRINRLGIIKTFTYIEGVEKNIGEQKKLIILRIAQECLQNILKHAAAKKIEVSFVYSSSYFELKIKDNGCGFNQDSMDKRRGLGLQNIITRAAIIGGKGLIDSIINKGTTITIILPYE